jgi:glycerol-3-phosphate dehydrogenase
VSQFIHANEQNKSLICECEMVSRGEIEYALKYLNVDNLVDLRRRTRLGMGPCQGEVCAYRAAGLFEEYGSKTGAESARLLKSFMQERWKGLRPVFWGDALREIEFTYWVYEELFGSGDILDDSENINEI